MVNHFITLSTSMKDYDRMLRVNELVKRELSEGIERDIAAEVNGLVTVTSAKVAPDLRSARVMISVLGAKEEAVLEMLERDRADLQNTLARNTSLKYTPILDFRIDRSLEKADEVLDIIDELDIDDTDQ